MMMVGNGKRKLMLRFGVFLFLVVSAFGAQANNQWTLMVMGVADESTLPADHPAYDRAEAALRGVLADDGHDVTITKRNFGLDCDQTNCAEVHYEDLMHAVEALNPNVEAVLFFRVRISTRETPAYSRQKVSVYVDLVVPKSNRSLGSWHDPGREHIDAPIEGLKQWQAEKAEQEALEAGSVMLIKIQSLSKVFVFKLIDFETRELDDFSANMRAREFELDEKKVEDDRRQLLHLIGTRQYQVETSLVLTGLRAVLKEVLGEVGAGQPVLRQTNSANSIVLVRAQMPFLFAYIVGSILILMLVVFLFITRKYRCYDRRLKLALKGDHAGRGIELLEEVRFLPRRKAWQEWEHQWQKGVKDSDFHLREATYALDSNDYEKAKAELALALRSNADNSKAKRLQDEWATLQQVLELYEKSEGLELQDPTRAVQLLHNALECNPNLSSKVSVLKDRIIKRSDQYLTDADEAIKDHNYESAIADVERALQNNRENQRAQGLQAKLPDIKRGYEIYLDAQSLVSTDPALAAQKLTQIASLNPNLSEQIKALELSAQQAHRQGGLRKIQQEVESLLGGDIPYAAISKADEGLSSIEGLGGFGEEKQALQLLRKRALELLSPLRGNLTGKRDASHLRLLPGSEVLVSRRRSSEVGGTGIAIGYKRLSRRGKQTRIYRAGSNFVIQDQGSTNGTCADGVFLSGGESHAIASATKLALGGNPERSDPGFCLLQFTPSTDLNGSVRVNFDQSALSFLDRSGMGNSWPDSELDLATQWRLVTDAISLGIVDGHLDFGALKSPAVLRFIWEQESWWVEPAGTAIDNITIGGHKLRSRVPLVDGALVEIAGVSIELTEALT